MKTKTLGFIVVALLCLIQMLNAQDKYAILISGDPPDYVPPVGTYIPNEAKLWKASWNDTYLMWEMLVYGFEEEYRYDNDKVFVLWADGTDWSITSDVAARYDAQESHSDDFPGDLDQFTDHSATLNNVEYLFEKLADGTDPDIPHIKQDDFLFVWVYGRNNYTTPDISDRSIGLYQTDELDDEDFYNLVNDIEAHRKAVWMDCWWAGAFQDEFNQNDEIFWMGSSTKYTWEILANDTYTINGNTGQVTENEIIDYVTYFHGEFDFHLYSVTLGKSPEDLTQYAGKNYSIADINTDNIISLQDTWDWASDYANGDYTYPLINNNSIGSTTSLKYPTLIHSDLDDNTTVRGWIGVSKGCAVETGNTLTIKENSIMDFLNSSNLTIDAGASLVIEDGVTIESKSGTRRIIVNGNLTIGKDVLFTGSGSDQIIIELKNSSATITIDDCIFEETAILSNVDDLTIKNSSFYNGMLYSNNGGDVELNKSSFDNSQVQLINAKGNNNITITNSCEFDNSIIFSYALIIEEYPDYLINNSTLTNNYDGIYIENSGDGHGSNEVAGCRITDIDNTAITVNNSEADIYDNEIYDNNYGVKSLNNSNVELYGSSTTSVRQKINDNTYYEVYASSGSFPSNFHWNEIKDIDNPQPMVYYSGPGSMLPTLDVTNNTWGGIYFSYLTDLYPSNMFIWSPIWTPSKSEDIAESIYTDAKEKIDNGEYLEAETLLEEIVTDYTSSIYAQAALKKLFTLEEMNSNDYAALIEYYETESAIQEEIELIKLSSYLINSCEIKLENWETAIDFFESIILEPELEEDSVFAIIDLGNLYLLMEELGYKSTYKGNLLEHVPTSIEKFKDKRDYLLSLVPGNQMSEEMVDNISKLKYGELLQNVPNPFMGSTEIWYNIKVESNVMIGIYDYTGKRIKTIQAGVKSPGHHNVSINGNDLSSGIYFYKLILNGIESDTKKMTILR